MKVYGNGRLFLAQVQGIAQARNLPNNAPQNVLVAPLIIYLVGHLQQQGGDVSPKCIVCLIMP